MKTIAIFSGYYLPFLGGIERYTNNLITELIKKKYKIILITSNYNKLKEYEKNKDLIIFRIPIYNLFKNRYPIPKKNNKYRSILKELDNYNIDRIIVNTRFHLTSLIGAKYGYKRKIPVYLIEHGCSHLTIHQPILDFFGRIYEHCLTKIIKKYIDYYYGISNECLEWLKHFKIEGNGVWYNAIKEFYNGKIIKDDENIIIAYAGRIIKQKGIEELIKSFLLLEKKYSNIKLYIIGDGNFLSYLKNNYYSTNITYTGKLSFEELIKYYEKTNIFVYAPSWPEGLGCSLLEAGLMECTLIGSNQGGIKEIIDNNENGILIETEEELYLALDKLIVNKELRNKLAEKMKIKINNKFTWKNNCQKIINDLHIK